MVRSRLAACFVVLLGLCFSSSPAHALIFPDGEPNQKTFDLVNLADITTTGFFDSTGNFLNQPSNVGLSGTLTLGRRPGPSIPSRPESDLNDVLSGTFLPIDDLDIVDFVLDGIVTTPTGQTATLPVNSDTAFLSVLGPYLYTNGQSVQIQNSAPAGTPLVDLTVDRFPDTTGFPNGQRLGDDDNDLIILQLFAGSINLVTGFIPAGVPQATTFTQLTPGNTLTIARSQLVPEPSSVALLLLACGAALGLRTRS